MARKNNVNKQENSKKAKFKDKLAMYDMLIANLIAGKAIIQPTQRLNNSQLAIGYSNIASETHITKYYLINGFPDFLQERLFDNIRNKCIRPGVKINFYTYATPYKINWESPEMRNRLNIWRRYTNENTGAIDVFDYRSQNDSAKRANRIYLSTKYLNEAELEHKRSLMLVHFLIEITARRDDESILNMIESIKTLKDISTQSDLRVDELSVNMIDWGKFLDPFSMQETRELDRRVVKRVLTDDLLANFNSYRQGRVGNTGAPLGIDVLSMSPVMRQFKEDPDAAENWLISAETGGGKSLWVKTLLTWLFALGFVVVIMDYEGDEYDNLANYIRAGNPDDVKIVSMGKGDTVYFDPCEIPDLTGDPKVDNELKENAINFILAIFRVIIHGLDGVFTQQEEKVLSLAISRMYDSAGVTDDKNTWYRSKQLRLSMVYDEIKMIVESKELVDETDDNQKHKAAIHMMDAASVYFEEGASKAGTFRNPVSANELYKARFIVFSFGMKGATGSIADPVILALKQLSVAYVNIQISNYCKYVRHCFNVKVWEEFQRWGTAKGSAETIINTITGGRKRGDVNFIITNDLKTMLDENNPFTTTLRQNIQNYVIGKIADKATRKSFCKTFELQECEAALDRIAKASTKVNKSANRYNKAFCIVLDNGKKAIAKAMLPDSLLNSQLFRTGVDVENGDKK
ncbi:MAG: DUF87 domain-containing protein [Lachnospiraceae bacterium]|nr:DUF87 domain-containing protein [Lachnospiraceae bacterium]